MAKLLTFLCVVSFISTALACSSALSDDTDLTTTPTKYSDSSAPYSVTSTLPKEKLGSSEGTPRELEAVWEAWALLNKEHIDRASFEPGAFEESAIKGLIDSVEDTHTSYVDPLVLQIEQTDLSGQFEGIGAHVRRREDGMIQIISPIEGGPAEAAGILAGDIILAVDGESIEGLELLEAVSKIRGPKGSIVSLTVKHIGQLETTIIEVSRDVIALPSVLLRSDPGDEITHIRITEFKGDTPMRLSEILNAELEAGSKGLILDLRSNPGGYLQQVFDITNMFLDDGIILLEERQNENVTWRASGGGFATNLPMVVLVNKYSASGSEILMGAFQDNDRATVIGEQTFGKGTVNVFRKLSNGGGLYMSVGRWYTPNKRPIEGEGLTPDILVTSRDSKEADIKQVDAAYDEINKLLND
ncbi:MAG TPA: S41 family peptidase [Dehalococcoidia bacterium]|nr:S41 family peptidase [Dehalococcoidia bacterium]